MKSILVTGGCGYIGSHTVLSLVENGYYVYVLDSNINSSPAVIKSLFGILRKKDRSFINNVKFFRGDLRDEKDIEKIFKHAIRKNIYIYGVIHFAGLKSIEESIFFVTIPICLREFIIEYQIYLIQFP